MSFKTLLIEKMDGIIFRSFPVSTNCLGLYRICYSLFLLVSGVPVFFWLDNLPDSFFNPPVFSLAAFFTEFPPLWFLVMLTLGTGFLAIFLLFGYHTRVTSIMLALFIVTGKSFNYSLGKIDHDFFIWLVPLIMAFSSWGQAYSIDSMKKGKVATVENNSWPINLLALILCLAMFSAGVPKILAGWLNPSHHAVRGYFLSSFYQETNRAFLAPLFLRIHSGAIWELFDYTAVIFEITFLFSLVRPNVFRAFLFLAIIFHVLNLLMLNISFISNCVLYLLFIDWKMVLNFLRRQKIFYSIPGLIKRKNLIIVSLVFTAFFFMVFNQSMNQSMFTLSPLRWVFKAFNFNYSKAVGALITFLSLAIAFINAFYFFGNRRAVKGRVTGFVSP